MKETKLVRNSSGKDISVEFGGKTYRFDAGSEKHYDADLADVAQHRHAHEGLKIVDLDHEAKERAEAGPKATLALASQRAQAQRDLQSAEANLADAKVRAEAAKVALDELGGKVVRNKSGSDITIGYGGTDYLFLAGKQRLVTDGLARVAQSRHGHDGLNIVQSPADIALGVYQDGGQTISGPLAPAGETLTPTAATPESFTCPHGDFSTNDKVAYFNHLASAHGLSEQQQKEAAAKALHDTEPPSSDPRVNSDPDRFPSSDPRFNGADGRDRQVDATGRQVNATGDGRDSGLRSSNPQGNAPFNQGNAPSNPQVNATDLDGRDRGQDTGIARGRALGDTGVARSSQGATETRNPQVNAPDLDRQSNPRVNTDGRDRGQQERRRRPRQKGTK